MYVCMYVYHEVVEVLVVEGLVGVSEKGVLGDHLVRLGELGVDLGQLVDGRGDAEARHVRRQQLLVQRVAQDVRLAPLLLPRGAVRVAVVPSSAAAVLAVIARVGGAGLTLGGGEPLVVEPRGRLVLRGGLVIREEGGGGVVVVGVDLVGEVVVVLERHVSVSVSVCMDDSIFQTCSFDIYNFPIYTYIITMLLQFIFTLITSLLINHVIYFIN